MASELYALSGIKIEHEWTGSVTRGENVKSDNTSSDLISDKKTEPVHICQRFSSAPLLSLYNIDSMRDWLLWYKVLIS